MNYIFVVSLGPPNLRQDYAFDELVRLAGASHVLACCFAEEMHQHEDKLRLVNEQLLLRNSREEIGSERPLPFIREMLAAGMEYVRDLADWVVMLNSDIIVKPKLFEALRETSAQFLTLRRTDVIRPQDTMGQLLPNGIDGIALRKLIWERQENAPVPDFVLGEPGWGEGMRLWGALQSKWQELDGGEIMHVVHDGVWRKTPLTDGAKRHNRRLYQFEKVRNHWRNQ